MQDPRLKGEAAGMNKGMVQGNLLILLNTTKGTTDNKD